MKEAYKSLYDENLINKTLEYGRLLSKVKKSKRKEYIIPLKIYKEILDKIRNILTDNEIFNIGMLTAMLKKGYISYNKEFVYIDEDIPEITGFNGISVLFGQGCCRNISHFLIDTLEKNYNFIINDEYSTNVDYLTLGLDQKDGLAYHDDSIDGGTHACIGLNYKNSYLIYDPTNIRLYQMNHGKSKDKFLQGDMICGNGKIIIYPHMLLHFENMSIGNMNKFVNELKLKKSLSENSKKEIIDCLIEGSFYVLNNEKIFDGFYNEIKPSLEKVNKHKVKILEDKR